MEDFEDDYENEDYENDEEYLEELHEEEDKRDIRVKRREVGLIFFFFFFCREETKYYVFHVLGLYCKRIIT